jgi:radical SAM superfamily enzyme YgiQ (UPF0313 family)
MNILAINPWIYDFAAYDFWLKPYGFLVILSYLKNKGVHIDYIDCLEKKATHEAYGRGKYYNEIIKKPQIFKSIPRYFKRYGTLKDDFQNQLQDKNPDYILITSSMTYWYPAIIDITDIIRKKFPGIPIIIGGTYATLLREHAKQNISCDYIFKTKEVPDFFKLLKIEYNADKLYSTLPLYEDFYSHQEYMVFRTSWGCPFNCSYCAITELSPGSFSAPQEKVIEFLIKYAQQGVKDFVLYDDAFLHEQHYAKKLLRDIRMLHLNLRFHTPNALHLRFLNEELAYLLKRTGFVNAHFGLETLNPQLQETWGGKVNREDLVRGIGYLKKGGFKNGEFSMYLLLGYPNQNLEELKKDAEFLHSLGAKVSLAEFSPVPGTKIFESYKESLSEPLLHNNSIFGFFRQDKIRDFWEIKNYVRQLNKELIS